MGGLVLHGMQVHHGGMHAGHGCHVGVACMPVCTAGRLCSLQDVVPAPGLTWADGSSTPSPSLTDGQDHPHPPCTHLLHPPEAS